MKIGSRLEVLVSELQLKVGNLLGGSLVINEGVQSIIEPEARLEGRLQIYIGPEQSHLGDMWALTSFILQTGLAVQVTCYSDEVADKFQRISSLFDAESDHVHFTVGDRKPGHFAPWSDDYSVFYGKRYLSTRRRWQAPSGGRPSLICFNFGAGWMAADKVPPYVAQVASELELRHNGAYIGLPLTLEAAAGRLAECDLFLSVDSGLAHVARSVGCPVALIEYKHNVFRGFPRSACGVHVVRSAAECLVLAAKAGRKELAGEDDGATR